MPPPINALQSTVGNGVVQRMLKRQNFSAATRRDMPVAPGDHRRHIVPHHTMKAALQQWWDATGSQTAGNNTELNSLQDVQKLLKKMNDNLSNLWPGQGAANSAIGMLAHNMTKPIEQISSQRLAGQAAYDVIAQYFGFQQNTQQQLADPIFSVVLGETNSREVVRYLRQVQLNAALDLPEGNPQASVAIWQELRGQFERIQNDPRRYTEADVLRLRDNFMHMPAPV